MAKTNSLTVDENRHTRRPVLVSWSGGKDSCLALYELKRGHAFDVAALITTVTEDYDRVSMHGVRRMLLERQAEALGLPLHQVAISKDATNAEYEERMATALTAYAAAGVDSVVFGDLFLTDVRAYREQFLRRLQMTPMFPVWHRSTTEFVRDFVRLGFKAITTCVNTERLDESFVGRMVDDSFLEALPPDVDPCGENGEFHTFVFDGPLFTEPVRFCLGAKVLRGQFWFCDLLPE